MRGDRPIRAALLCALAALATTAPAGAATPARVFDAPGQGHATRCVPLASPLAALRFADGSATGFALTGGTALDSENCAAGSVRLDLHETIPSDAGSLAFHRGGFGYEDR